MKHDLIRLVEAILRDTLSRKNKFEAKENLNYGKELTMISNELIKFYYLHDELYNTCHSKIIKELYIRSKKKTLLSESLNLYISERTLFNYRKQYCKIWLKLLSYHKNELKIGKNFADLFKE